MKTEQFVIERINDIAIEELPKNIAKIIDERVKGFECVAKMMNQECSAIRSAYFQGFVDGQQAQETKLSPEQFGEKK